MLCWTGVGAEGSSDGGVAGFLSCCSDLHKEELALNKTLTSRSVTHDSGKRMASSSDFATYNRVHTVRFRWHGDALGISMTTGCAALCLFELDLLINILAKIMMN